MTMRSSLKHGLVGRFISDKNLGPAKVVAIENNKYKLEYFLSPWNRKTGLVQNQELEHLRLDEQTRVYTEIDGRWRIGRVIRSYWRDDRGYDYDVRFANHLTARFPEEDIFSRCWIAHDDPTSSLASGTAETQYWHEHRQRLGQSLLAQRSACRGLSSLLSSRIELVPHQIEVARRVLEDPLQRYLLADEVGMGKTIEAGIIIRQFLLSNPQGGVVWVIVPETLKNQWRNELNQKFGTNEFPNRVYVFGFGDLNALPLDAPAFLVLDEAHHVVSNDIPLALQKFALAAPRLLLLSATPALGQVEILLRLLRLIDPDCYSAVKLDDFQEQVDMREKIGIFLRGLRADANLVVLRQRLRSIAQLFPNDGVALELGEVIAQSLRDGDSEATRKSINILRGHIADVHRVHQRLIRTRRRDAVDWAFRPRGPVVEHNGDVSLEHVRLSWIEDARYMAVFDLFEQWRMEMSLLYPRGAANRKELLNWLVLLFEALGIGVNKFVKILDAIPTQFLNDFWRDALLAETNKGNSEPSRAEQVACDIRRHLDLLQRTQLDRVPRIAVFGSDEFDVRECAREAIALMGNRKVIIASDLANETTDLAWAFESDANAQILFCCSTEEEGLNLHFIDAIVHLDLPLSPSRIEQRIGRLDRFGRKTDRFEQRVVLPAIEDDSNPWVAWYEVLAQAFYIFNLPVTDVQFSLEDVANDMATALLEDGACGLRKAIPSVRQRLIDERDRMDNQYALDRVLQEEDAASGLFSALDDLDSNEDEIARATKGWMVDTLAFRCEGDYSNVFRFVWDPDRTSLAARPWAQVFQQGLLGHHTFKRRHTLRASSPESAQLLRIGSLLMRRVERQYRWDDRGTAFATWRQTHEPNCDEWLAFKLCYIVEARTPGGLKDDERAGINARLDGYLPPWFDVLYVDAELRIIEDPERLAMLNLPYQTGRDSNLGNHPEILDAFIDSAHFERLCHTVRESSESWLRDRPDFRERVAQAIDRGSLDINRRLARLEQRQISRAATGQPEDSGLAREIELNQALLPVLPDPRIRLDSIGVFILSSRSPQEFMKDLT